MKTLSDFKKALKVGVKLEGTHHLAITGRDEQGKAILGDKYLGIREVSIVQSNSFALSTKKHDDTMTDSWCSYPKASECIFNADNSLTILEEQRDGKKIPVLTYKIIE